MRVVLDTNVIVAAFATRGLCSEVLEVCLAEHSIITSGQILSEIKEGLIGKIRLPEKMARGVIDFIKNQSEVVIPEILIGSVCRDKDDNIVIGTALSGDAVFVITGDKDLLTLKKYRGIEFITPRQFWSLLRT